MIVWSLKSCQVPPTQALIEPEICKRLAREDYQQSKAIECECNPNWREIEHEHGPTLNQLLKEIGWREARKLMEVLG